MKIARLFTRFFQNGEGYLRQTGVEDQPVFLDENLLEFKQLDKTYTIRGTKSWFVKSLSFVWVSFLSTSNQLDVYPPKRVEKSVTFMRILSRYPIHKNKVFDFSR